MRSRRTAVTCFLHPSHRYVLEPCGHRAGVSGQQSDQFWPHQGRVVQVPALRRSLMTRINKLTHSSAQQPEACTAIYAHDARV